MKDLNLCIRFTKEVAKEATNRNFTASENMLAKKYNCFITYRAYTILTSLTQDLYNLINTNDIEGFYNLVIVKIKDFTEELSKVEIKADTLETYKTLDYVTSILRQNFNKYLVLEK